jgi:hypothetical protein
MDLLRAVSILDALEMIASKSPHPSEKMDNLATMTITYKALQPELDRVHAYSRSIDCFPWTSDDHQRDVQRFTVHNSAETQYRSVLEVGLSSRGPHIQQNGDARPWGVSNSDRSPVCEEWFVHGKTGFAIPTDNFETLFYLRASRPL